jgi:hypothetical protein
VAKKRAQREDARDSFEGELTPDDEQWALSVSEFLQMLPLENKTARRQVRRLMLALEQEVLAIFKLARKLEDPYYKPAAFDQLRERYGKLAIVQRLSRAFAGEHVKLAKLSKLSTRIGRLSKHWYRQGGLILDCIEHLRVSVAVYEAEVKSIKKRRANGRGASLAWDYLVKAQRRWERSDEEVMSLLIHVGFLPDNENNRLLLQDRIKKHRLRRGVKKTRRT